MSLIPAQILEHARGAWVGVDCDATGGNVGEDQVLELGLCVQRPSDGVLLGWSGWVQVLATLLEEDDARAPWAARGHDALELAGELQGLARVARGFVCHRAFAWTARFLAGFPWQIWGPWHDVRARVRATHPQIWTPGLRTLCQAFAVPTPWPEHRAGPDARAALELWLRLEAPARAA